MCMLRKIKGISSFYESHREEQLEILTRTRNGPMGSTGFHVICKGVPLLEECLINN